MAANDSHATPTKLSADDVFDIADALLDAAQATFGRRRDTPNLANSQRQELIDSETSMRSDADSFRAAGIVLLGADAGVSAKFLRDQIAEAKKVIEATREVRHVIEVATALASFGGAIATGQAMAILKAGRSLQHTIEKQNV